MKIGDAGIESVGGGPIGADITGLGEDEKVENLT